MMDGRPKLPARPRRRRETFAGDSQQVPDLQLLQQQLVNHAAFKQMVDQPDKVAAVIRSDPILQQAAASDPQVAALLDPATMQQAMNALMQPGAAASAAVPIQQQALMKLQNYALQLQQARAAGLDVQQQQDACSLHASRGSVTAATDAAAGVASQQEGMWAALQQRLNKFQQRSQVLGQAGAMPPPPLQQEQWESAAAAGDFYAAGLTAAAAAAAREPRVSDGSLTMQELLTAFPDFLSAGGPTSSSHATIGLMSAVAAPPQPADAAGPGTGGSLPPYVQLPQLPQLPLLPSEPTALPFSPNWQQQQGLQSAGALWPMSASDPTVASAAAAFSSEGSSRPLSAVLRSSSALGHRILRPHSSSPIPMGSGSTPLGIQQLGSGEVIVDITPPTRVTKELSWSLDPDADYVVDASASGSFNALPGSTAAASAALFAAAGSFGTATSLDGLGNKALGRGAAITGMVHSSSAGNCTGMHVPDSGASLRPLLESSSSMLAVAAAPGSAVSYGGEAGTAAAAAVAAGSAPARRVSSSSTGSSSARSKGPPRPKQSAAAAATKNTAAASRTAAGLPAAAAANGTNTQQPQQQAGAAAGGPPWPGNSSGPISAGAAGAAAGAAGAAGAAAVRSAGPASFQGYAFDTSLSPGAAAAGAGGKVLLHPGSYYEDVAPSMWRPSDAGEYPGDYLELYRRAYCSYADAMFPPLWLSLISLLASSQLVPLWQLLLLGLASFWGGMYVMAVKWAGVPTSQLSLSRVAPMFVVSLEVMCLGSFVWYVLPAMWLGQSVKCLVLLAGALTMLALHLAAHLQDPGYTPIPDTEEGPYARHLSSHPTSINTTGPSANVPHLSSPDAAAEQQQQQSSTADLSCRQDQAAAAGAGETAPLLAGKPKQQHQPGPKLAGRTMTSCWTCGVERNLRSKHCPICKRCVERFDHHCPVIGNCVGARNHRTFVGYLAALLLCQLLFCQLLGGLLVQQHLTQLASGPGLTAGLTAGSSHGQTFGHALSKDQILLSQQLAGLDSAAVPAAAGGASGMAAAGVLVEGAGVGSLTAVQAASTQDSSTTVQATGTAAAADAAPAAAAAGASDVGGSEAVSGAAAGVTEPIAGPVVADDALSSSGSSSSKAAELEVLMRGAGWGLQGWWLTVKALWAAAGPHAGLLLLLLVQVPGLFVSCSLLFRALALAAANLTVNEWVNRHRYLYLQHRAAGFCNRFDRGPAHNCWEFWMGPPVVDWWALWQQGEEELLSSCRTVLTTHCAAVLIRFWDVRWAKYQQKLTAARERRRELKLQRRMQALGLVEVHD